MGKSSQYDLVTPPLFTDLAEEKPQKDATDAFIAHTNKTDEVELGQPEIIKDQEEIYNNDTSAETDNIETDKHSITFQKPRLNKNFTPRKSHKTLIIFILLLTFIFGVIGYVVSNKNNVMTIQAPAETVNSQNLSANTIKTNELVTTENQKPNQSEPVTSSTTRINSTEAKQTPSAKAIEINSSPGEIADNEKHGTEEDLNVDVAEKDIQATEEETITESNPLNQKLFNNSNIANNTRQINNSRTQSAAEELYILGYQIQHQNLQTAISYWRQAMNHSAPNENIYQKAKQKIQWAENQLQNK